MHCRAQLQASTLPAVTTLGSTLPAAWLGLQVCSQLQEASLACVRGAGTAKLHSEGNRVAWRVWHQAAPTCTFCLPFSCSCCGGASGAAACFCPAAASAASAPTAPGPPPSALPPSAPAGAAAGPSLPPPPPAAARARATSSSSDRGATACAAAAPPPALTPNCASSARCQVYAQHHSQLGLTTSLPCAGRRGGAGRQAVHRSAWWHGIRKHRGIS